MASTSLCPHLVQEYFKRVGSMTEAYKSQIVKFVDYRKISNPLIDRKIILKAEHEEVMRLATGEERMLRILAILQKRMWGLENLITALIETEVESWLVEEMFQKYVHYVVNEIRRLQSLKRCQCFARERRSLLRKALSKFFQVCDSWLYTIGTHLGFLDQTIYPCCNILQPINNLLPFVREKEETIIFPEIETTPLSFSSSSDGGSEVTITEIQSSDTDAKKPETRKIKLNPSPISTKTSSSVTLNGRSLSTPTPTKVTRTASSLSSQRVSSSPRTKDAPKLGAATNATRLSPGAPKSIHNSSLRPMLSSGVIEQEQQERHVQEQIPQTDNKVLPRTTTVAVSSVDENMNTIVVYLPVHLPRLPSNPTSSAQTAEKPLEQTCLLDPIKLHGVTVVQDHPGSITPFTPPPALPFRSTSHVGTMTHHTTAVNMDTQVSSDSACALVTNAEKPNSSSASATSIVTSTEGTPVAVQPPKMKGVDMGTMTENSDVIITPTRKSSVQSKPIVRPGTTRIIETVTGTRKISTASQAPSATRRPSTVASTTPIPARPTRKLTPMPVNPYALRSTLTATRTARASLTMTRTPEKPKVTNTFNKVVPKKASTKIGTSSRSSQESINTDTDRQSVESVPSAVGKSASSSIEKLPEILNAEVNKDSMWSRSGSGRVLAISSADGGNDSSEKKAADDLSTGNLKAAEELKGTMGGTPAVMNATETSSATAAVDAPEVLHINHPILENLEVTLVTIPEEYQDKKVPASTEIPQTKPIHADKPDRIDTQPNNTINAPASTTTSVIKKSSSGSVPSKSAGTIIKASTSTLKPAKAAEKPPTIESTRTSSKPIERKVSVGTGSSKSATEGRTARPLASVTVKSGTTSKSSSVKPSFSSTLSSSSSSRLINDKSKSPPTASTHSKSTATPSTTSKITAIASKIIDKEDNLLRVYHGAWGEILESDVNLFKSSASFPSAFSKKLKLPSVVDSLAHVLDKSQSLPSLLSPESASNLIRSSTSESMLTTIVVGPRQLARTLAESRKNKDIKSSSSPASPKKYVDASAQTTLRAKAITSPSKSSVPAATTTPRPARVRTISTGSIAALRKPAAKPSTPVKTTVGTAPTASPDTSGSEKSSLKVATVPPSTRPAWNSSKKPASPQPPPVFGERFTPFTIEDYNFQQWANEWTARQDKKKSEANNAQDDN